MKSFLGAAFAVVVLVAFSTSAPAQSLDAVMKRLEALEKENSTLRQRVHRLEAGKQRGASAQPDTPVSPATPAPSYNSPSMSSQASVNKAPALVAAPSHRWNGPYLGIHGGYAFSDWLPPTPENGIGTLALHGGFGGIQAGYNIRLAPHWLIGIEQDVSGGGVSGTQSQVYPQPTITGKTQAFGTMRGRFGYIWNDVLLYQTAGVAWAYNRAKLNFNTPAQQADAGASALVFTDSHLQWGVAVGAGVEWYVSPDISVKGEFQYIYLAKEQYFGGTGQSSLAAWPVATARIGLNRHFQ